MSVSLAARSRATVTSTRACVTGSRGVASCGSASRSKSNGGSKRSGLEGMSKACQRRAKGLPKAGRVKGVPKAGLSKAGQSAMRPMRASR
eukprot:scaffold6312_cov58-Phaeocystis_antarctica.AAC.2